MPDEVQDALEAQQDGPGGAGRPDWLPDRFENEQALLKSWEEGQRTLTQAQQRAAAAEQATADMVSRLDELENRLSRNQVAGQAYDPSTDPIVMATVQAYEEGDYQRVQQLQDMRFAQMMQAGLEMIQRQQPQAQQQAPPDTLDKLAAGYVDQEVARRLGADYDTLRDDLRATMQQAPHHVRDYVTDPDGAVEDLVRLAGWIKAEKLSERGAQLGNQPPTGHAKRLAQTVPGSGGRVAGTPNARDELIARFKATAPPGLLAG